MGRFDIHVHIWYGEMHPDSAYVLLTLLQTGSTGQSQHIELDRVIASGVPRRAAGVSALAMAVVCPWWLRKLPRLMARSPLRSSNLPAGWVMLVSSQHGGRPCEWLRRIHAVTLLRTRRRGHAPTSVRQPADIRLDDRRSRELSEASSPIRSAASFTRREPVSTAAPLRSVTRPPVHATSGIWMHKYASALRTDQAPLRSFFPSSTCASILPSPLALPCPLRPPRFLDTTRLGSNDAKATHSTLILEQIFSARALIRHPRTSTLQRRAAHRSRIHTSTSALAGMVRGPPSAPRRLLRSPRSPAFARHVSHRTIRPLRPRAHP